LTKSFIIFSHILEEKSLSRKVERKREVRRQEIVKERKPQTNVEDLKMSWLQDDILSEKSLSDLNVFHETENINLSKKGSRLF